jgi:hypothetical protein
MSHPHQRDGAEPNGQSYIGTGIILGYINPQKVADTNARLLKPLTPEQRNANVQRLHIDRIEAACYALDGLNPALAAKIRSALA